MEGSDRLERARVLQSWLPWFLRGERGLCDFPPLGHTCKNLYYNIITAFLFRLSFCKDLTLILGVKESREPRIALDCDFVRTLMR